MIAFIFIISLFLIDAVILYFGMPVHAAIWAPLLVAIPMLVPSWRKSWLSFNFRLLSPLLMGGICLILAMELAAHKEWRDSIAWLNNAYSHNENFFAVLATLYAVFTALILVKVIEDHENLKQSIQKEASKIRSILQFLKYFEDENSKAANGEKIIHIKELFYEYLTTISLSKGKGADENLPLIESCVEVVATLEAKDKNDEISLAQIMHSLDELFTLRARRIDCINTSISPYLLFVIIFMSLAIITPFYLSSEGKIEGNYYIIFTLGIAFSFLFNMILDIGSPHFGAWTVSLKPFEDVGKLIKRSEKNQINNQT